MASVEAATAPKIPPEQPGDTPGQQDHRNGKPRQTRREHHKVHAGKAVHHRLVKPQCHHDRRRGHARDDDAHAPQDTAEIIPPEVWLHGDLHYMLYIKKSEKHRRSTQHQTHPGPAAAALLARLPEKGRDGPHDQPDKEPGGNGIRPVHAGGDAPGQPEKADAPADAQRRQPPPILGQRRSRMGQNLHEGPVNVKHHRQHAAGNSRQNGACADEHTAQKVAQPVDHGIFVAAFQLRRPPLVFLVFDSSSFASRFQSDTAEKFVKNLWLCNSLQQIVHFAYICFLYRWSYRQFYSLTIKPITCTLQNR